MVYNKFESTVAETLSAGTGQPRSITSTYGFKAGEDCTQVQHPIVGQLYARRP